MIMMIWEWAYIHPHNIIFQRTKQWRSQTKMVTEANQFILLMIGAIQME